MSSAVRTRCLVSAARSTGPVYRRSYSAVAGDVRRRPSLTLYTGTDCQLCDVVKAELDKIVAEVPPFDLQLYNIRDESMPDVQRWRRAYQYDIPVLHLDGKEIARHRVKGDEIARLIDQAARSEPEQ